MGVAVDIVGQVFGKLTVAAAAGIHKESNGRSSQLWLCQCSCGREATIRGFSLRHGRQLRRCQSTVYTDANRLPRERFRVQVGGQHLSSDAEAGRIDGIPD